MFAKYDLIMRGNHNIIMLVIAKGRLNEREKLALLTRGTYEEVNFLIETQSNRKEAEKLRQMKMIRFNSRKKVEQFIARRRFVQEAEDFFFKHGAFSLLVKYVMHYQIPNGQEMILKREDRPEILGYLSKHWLCEASEKLLLKRGIHAEIKAYIKKHCFHDEPEVHFVKRGNHREIMLYLANHSLCDEAQRELIYRRNNEEIMYFISRYPLADIAVEALCKCGSDTAFDLWMQDLPRRQNGSEDLAFASAKAVFHRPAAKTKNPAREFLAASPAWHRL